MNDIYQTITDKIIAELEAGTAPWVRPWSGEADPFPRNALSQRPYRGINHVLLGMEAHCRGYASNQWLTFRQAHQLGAHVRKGERAATIIYYEARIMDKEDSETVADGNEPEKRFIPLLKVFSVFNVDQVEGLPASYQELPAALIPTGMPAPAQSRSWTARGRRFAIRASRRSTRHPMT